MRKHLSTSFGNPWNSLWRRFGVWLGKPLRNRLRRRPVLEQLEDRTVPSLVISEVKVINTTGNSLISNAVNLNGSVLFAATDGTNGTQLWESDGTAAGTVALTSVNTGGGGLMPTDLTVAGNLVFFAGNDGTHGNELWESNGSASGTFMVADINSGAGSSNPTDITAVGNKVFFSATDGTAGSELWESDGSASGTFMVDNINPGTAGTVANLTNVNGTLFFTANDGTHGTELWESNGSASGTFMVDDINPGAGSSSPGNLTAVGNTLYFTADDGTHGTELWMSNGSASTTVMVDDINPGAGSSSPGNLTAVGNTLFFAADDGTHGTELWMSSGSASTTVMVDDINPGAGNSSPSYLTAVGSTLYFAANDGTHGTELWESNGSASGTFMVDDINPGAGSSSPTMLTNFNGTLVFAANDGTHGEQLWESSGSASTTTMLQSLNASSVGLAPTELTVAGNKLFFAGNDTTGTSQLFAAQNIPQLTSITSTTANGTYTTGAQIDVTLNFDTPVTLAGGNMTVTLNDGATVTITPFTDATTASGIYTVAAGQSANPLDVTSVSLATGATLEDAQGDMASLTLPTGHSLANTSDIIINTTSTVPQVASITSTTANGTYGTGAQIDVTLNFNSPVTLAGGNLTVTLNDGGTVTIAPFSNAMTVSGTYTVAAGQNANPLDVTSLALAAGATLQNAQGENATLTLPTGHTLANTSDIIINTTTTVTPVASKVAVEVTSSFTAQFVLNSNGGGSYGTTDAVFNYGLSSDSVVVGDWDDSGFDSVGVVRANGAAAEWILDTNENYTYDAGDAVYNFGLSTDHFVTGDWTGSGTTKIGVVQPGVNGVAQWVLDTAGTGVYTPSDAVYNFGLNTDTFITGDWTGNGKTDIGIVRPGPNGVLEWVLDTSGTGSYTSSDAVYYFGSNGDIPIVGDWNGTGKDEIGVAIPQANGSMEWVLDTAGTGVYTPSDTVYFFGTSKDIPLVGSWKPTALLMAAGGEQTGASVQPIAADATFAAIVNDAIGSWTQAGLSPQLVSKLENVTYTVGNLGNGLLGETSGNTVTIDATAAGYGWSESPNPQTGRMDLFTALEHEMGHELGLPDQAVLPGDLMYESLQTGVRKTPSLLDVNAAF